MGCRSAARETGASDDRGRTDSSVHFTSNTQDRVSTQTVPLLDEGHLMQLPRGQAFVLMSGGQLYKVQFPEVRDPPDRLPSPLEPIARDMARRYQQVTGMALQSQDSIHYTALTLHREPEPADPAPKPETTPAESNVSTPESVPRAQPMAPPRWGGVAAQWYVPTPDPAVPTATEDGE